LVDDESPPIDWMLSGVCCSYPKTRRSGKRHDHTLRNLDAAHSILLASVECGCRPSHPIRVVDGASSTVVACRRVT
jgi:hypothetical protein